MTILRLNPTNKCDRDCLVAPDGSERFRNLAHSFGARITRDGYIMSEARAHKCVALHRHGFYHDGKQYRHADVHRPLTLSWAMVIVKMLENKKLA